MLALLTMLDDVIAGYAVQLGGGRNDRNRTASKYAKYICCLVFCVASSYIAPAPGMHNVLFNLSFCQLCYCRWRSHRMYFIDVHIAGGRVGLNGGLRPSGGTSAHSQRQGELHEEGPGQC